MWSEFYSDYGVSVNGRNEVGSVEVVMSICVGIGLCLFEYPKSS